MRQSLVSHDGLNVVTPFVDTIGFRGLVRGAFGASLSRVSMPVRVDGSGATSIAESSHTGQPAITATFRAVLSTSSCPDASLWHATVIWASHGR